MDLRGVGSEFPNVEYCWEHCSLIGGSWTCDRWSVVNVSFSMTLPSSLLCMF